LKSQIHVMSLRRVCTRLARRGEVTRARSRGRLRQLRHATQNVRRKRAR
jgi:hypothetical protein